jgi:hypothetical protein
MTGLPARPAADPDARRLFGFDGLEARVAAAVVVIATVLFVAFVLLAPPTNPTYDDAKYIGVGRSVLAGIGPYTLFGGLFLKHSPVWPVLLTAPEAVLGVDPIAVGHVLNAASVALILVLVASIGWKIRPAVGAFSVVALVGLPYTFGLARTAGIDLPSIALTFGYLVLGHRAVERGSARTALAAGVLFGLSFLIKETILPFAPVPFLAGAIRGVSWTRLLRAMAATLLSAAVVMGWWFAIYAGYTGKVYRADFPAWTLAPIVAACVVLMVVGFAAEPIARRLAGRRSLAGAIQRLPAAIRARGPSLVGWFLLATWLSALYVFFSRTPKLLGASLLDPDQVLESVQTLLQTAVHLAVIYALGALLLVRWRPGGAAGRAVTDLLVAVLCGVPLVFLVIGVGETPRHYFAEIALVMILATAGWVTALDRVLRQRDRGALVGLALVATAAGVAVLANIGFASPRLPRLLLIGGAGGLVLVAGGGAVAWWLERRGRLATVGLSALVVLAAIGTVGVVGVHASRINAGVSTAELAASARIADWIAANVPPGTPVAFGPYLSMETSIGLPAGSKVIALRFALETADPAAPLGMRGAGSGDDDLLAVDPAPFKANQFNVYSRSQILHTFQVTGARYWIYSVAEGLSSVEILNALTPEAGFTEVATLHEDQPARRITTHIFQVDLDHLALPTDRLWISPLALERLVDRLERSPTVGSPAAKALVSRIVRSPDGSLDPFLDRLRKLAGP